MNNNSALPSKRNYGIDLLRLLSMFYVCVLHCLGRAGILNAAEVGSAQYQCAWLLEIFAFCAVNVFAMISGYVAYSDTPRKTRYAPYLRLWLEVVFYGLVIALIFSVFVPGSVTAESLIADLLPVRHKLYWYFRAYTGVFLISPLLNHGLRACSERTAFGVLVLIFAVFSIYAPASFELNGGYSFAWLLLMYLAGGVLKKCRIGERLPWYFAAGGIVLLCGTEWLMQMFWERIPAVLHPSWFHAVFPFSYTSAIFVGSAVFYVILFSKIKVGAFGAKLLRFAAPGAFAVYVIQCNHYIWKAINGVLSSLARWPAAATVGAVLGISLCVVVVCVPVDWLRQRLFRLCRVDAFTDWLDGKARAAAGACLRRIGGKKTTDE